MEGKPFPLSLKGSNRVRRGERGHLARWRKRSRNEKSETSSNAPRAHKLPILNSRVWREASTKAAEDEKELRL